MGRDHTYDYLTSGFFHFDASFFGSALQAFSKSFIPTGVGGGIENGYTAPEGSAGKGNGPEGVHIPHRERNDGGACF